MSEDLSKLYDRIVDHYDWRGRVPRRGGGGALSSPTFSRYACIRNSAGRAIYLRLESIVSPEALEPQSLAFTRDVVTHLQGPTAVLPDATWTEITTWEEAIAAIEDAD
jgi:hypothetical protein